MKPVYCETLILYQISKTLLFLNCHSGRFSFLVEDTIHVAVASTDIVLTTARAIVIATDRQLQHTGQVARRVAAIAGPGFSHACQKFLQQKTCGLQVCLKVVCMLHVIAGFFPYICTKKSTQCWLGLSAGCKVGNITFVDTTVKFFNVSTINL